MSIRLCPTEDGSHTLYDEELDVHYRSTQGATSESQYVFLEGTQITNKTMPWRIVELGFGGAVNFLMTAQAFLEKQGNGVLTYHSIDYAPVDPTLIEHEIYASWVQDPTLVQLVKRTLQTARETQETAQESVVREGKQIELILHPKPWQELDLSDVQAHAIYHDPFGPRANPQSWTTACFAFLRDAATPTAILATYGAASHARKAMIEAGWTVAKAPGAGRKREMTLAALSPTQLEGHKIIPNERYTP